MSEEIIWNVTTSVRDGRKEVLVVIGALKNGVEVSFQLGDQVQTIEDNILVHGLHAGSVGKIVTLFDPVTCKNFVYVQFGEGLTRKIWCYAFDKVINISKSPPVPA